MFCGYPIEQHIENIQRTTTTSRRIYAVITFGSVSNRIGFGFGFASPFVFGDAQSLLLIKNCGKTRNMHAIQYHLETLQLGSKIYNLRSPPKKDCLSSFPTISGRGPSTFGDCKVKLIDFSVKSTQLTVFIYILCGYQQRWWWVRREEWKIELRNRNRFNLN